MCHILEIYFSGDLSGVRQGAKDLLGGEKDEQADGEAEESDHETAAEKDGVCVGGRRASSNRSRRKDGRFIEGMGLSAQGGDEQDAMRD
jgi:hypothetical protein